MTNVCFFPLIALCNAIPYSNRLHFTTLVVNGRDAQLSRKARTAGIVIENSSFTTLKFLLVLKSKKTTALY